MPPPAPAWQFNVAYALLAAPLVYVAVEPTLCPPPCEQVIRLYALIGLACGAGVFVVRRRRRDVAGWVGLIAWGGLSLTAVVAAVLRS